MSYSQNKHYSYTKVNLISQIELLVELVDARNQVDSTAETKTTGKRQTTKRDWNLEIAMLVTAIKTFILHMDLAILDDGMVINLLESMLEPIDEPISTIIQNSIASRKAETTATTGETNAAQTTATTGGTKAERNVVSPVLSLVSFLDGVFDDLDFDSLEETKIVINESLDVKWEWKGPGESVWVPIEENTKINEGFVRARSPGLVSNVIDIARAMKILIRKVKKMPFKANAEERGILIQAKKTKIVKEMNAQIQEKAIIGNTLVPYHVTQPFYDRVTQLIVNKNKTVFTDDDVTDEDVMGVFPTLLLQPANMAKAVSHIQKGVVITVVDTASDSSSYDSSDDYVYSVSDSSSSVSSDDDASDSSSSVSSDDEDAQASSDSSGLDSDNSDFTEALRKREEADKLAEQKKAEEKKRKQKKAEEKKAEEEGDTKTDKRDKSYLDAALDCFPKPCKSKKADESDDETEKQGKLLLQSVQNANREREKVDQKRQADQKKTQQLEEQKRQADQNKTQQLEEQKRQADQKKTQQSEEQKREEDQNKTQQLKAEQDQAEQNKAEQLALNRATEKERDSARIRNQPEEESNEESKAQETKISDPATIGNPATIENTATIESNTRIIQNVPTSKKYNAEQLYGGEPLEQMRESYYEVFRKANFDSTTTFEQMKPIVCRLFPLCEVCYLNRDLFDKTLAPKEEIDDYVKMEWLLQMLLGLTPFPPDLKATGMNQEVNGHNMQEFVSAENKNYVYYFNDDSKTIMELAEADTESHYKSSIPAGELSAMLAELSSMENTSGSDYAVSDYASEEDFASDSSEFAPDEY
jgi:hypothetical protein